MKLTHLRNALLAALLLAPLGAHAQATTNSSKPPTTPTPTSLGGQQSLGAFQSLAVLSASFPAINQNPGTLAFTLDQGEVIVMGGAWVTIGGGGGGTAANPTGTVGLSTVNGVLTTYMRSDAAPPLSQSITPTWTGVHTFTQTIVGSINGNAATATVLSSTPTNCGAGIAATGVAANGNAVGCFTPGGGLTSTGSPANGNLAKWSGAATLTNGDLSGDVTTSGTLATSVVKVNNAAVPTSAAVLGSNGSGQLISQATTGSGNNVLATSPALTTPNLGTPSAINLSNATALPCAAMPALTGDATSSAGSCGTTVSQINGKIFSVLLQSGAPFILLPNGTMGNNGAFTAGTALPTTYAKGWCWAPTHWISATVPASGTWYYCQGSSTTAFTFCNNTYTSGAPTLPGSCTAFSTTGPGAVTQTTGTNITGPSLTLAANSMGVNGELQVEQDASFTNNANAKNILAILNTTTCAEMGGAGQPNGSTSLRIRNRGVANSQVCAQNGVAFFGAGFTYMSVDTTAAQTLGLQLEEATATDVTVLESYSFKEYQN